MPKGASGNTDGGTGGSFRLSQYQTGDRPQWAGAEPGARDYNDDMYAIAAAINGINSKEWDTANLKNLAVTAGKLANDAVTARSVSTDAVLAKHIKAWPVGGTTQEKDATGIHTAHIADKAVTTAKLADDIQIAGTNIKNPIEPDAVTAQNPQTGIPGSKIVKKSITADRLADDFELSTESIAEGSIAGSKLKDAWELNDIRMQGQNPEPQPGINAATKIIDKSITYNKVADDAIRTSHIANWVANGNPDPTLDPEATGIYGAQIANATIENKHLKVVSTTAGQEYEGITGDKIANNTITLEKMAKFTETIPAADQKAVTYDATHHTTIDAWYSGNATPKDDTQPHWYKSKAGETILLIANLQAQGENADPNRRMKLLIQYAESTSPTALVKESDWHDSPNSVLAPATDGTIWLSTQCVDFFPTTLGSYYKFRAKFQSASGEFNAYKIDLKPLIIA